MRLTFDGKPHPHLRCTIRLTYLHPFRKDWQDDYSFLPDSSDNVSTSFENLIYERLCEIEEEILEAEFGDAEDEEFLEIDIKKDVICSVSENTFTHNNILSDKICNYLIEGCSYINSIPSEELQRMLDVEFYYLEHIKADYLVEDVARAILTITRNPKYDYAQKVMAVWGVTLRPTYIEYQLRSIINQNNINDQLRKLLKEDTDEDLRRLKIKLDYLMNEWNLLYEGDNHKRAILVYRFLNDCNLINRNNESLKLMMEIVYSYLSLPPCTYNKEIQLTEPSKKEYETFNNGDKLNAVTKRKCNIYRSINTKWGTFKANRLG